MAQPYVRIDGVTKTFGYTPVVDNVSLEIQQGEIFCLLGGSGSGKTTLLRMLAGFETPTAGRVFIDGQDMTGIAPCDRPVNMMFQSYALFPHMTVEGNVAFGLEQEKLPRAQIRERVAQIVEMVKMAAFSGRKPHQLSGGQRQRVALARALVKRPKLLLLDEPLGALDRKLREYTQFELLSIQKKLGVTFIVVTHDQSEAMTLASRIGVMNHGKIVQIGTPLDIYEYPQTKFVADFVGSVNLFDGELVEDEAGHVRIRCQELESLVHVDHGISSAPDVRVSVAIRPEKISIERDPTTRHENVAAGIVKEVAYMGDMSIFMVELASGKLVRVTLPNVARRSEDRFIAEERVYLSWQPSSPVVLTQ